MSNIVSLRRKASPQTPQIPVISASEEAQDFILNELYMWALEKGIDTETTDFKYESATIMTVLQGMLWKKNSGQQQKA